jgi:hypothetical protein
MRWCFSVALLMSCFGQSHCLAAHGRSAYPPISSSSFDSNQASASPSTHPNASPSAGTVSASVGEIPFIEVHVLQKNETGNSYQIGDRIPLYIEVNPEWVAASPTFHFKLPEDPSPDAKSLADLGWYLDPTPQLLASNLRFVISPIQTGNLTLPSLQVLKEDETLIARTRPVSFQVQELKDQKKNPPVYVDPILISLATKYWIMIGLVSFILAALVAYLLRRFILARRARKLVSDIPPLRREPAHITALREISDLYARTPFAPETLKPVAFGVSEILKTFLSERFKVDANESTTDEMIALLRAEAVPQESLKEINLLFQKLDLVKFTKQSLNHMIVTRDIYQAFREDAEKLIRRWPQPEIERAP